MNNDHIKSSKMAHGGNLSQLSKQSGFSKNQILDYSANINPLGLPKGLDNIIENAIKDIKNYPEPFAESFVNQIANKYNLSPSNIIAGNGSSEILYTIARILKTKRVIIPSPSYIDYAKAFELSPYKPELIFYPLEKDFSLNLNKFSASLKTNDVVLIGQPNNPTGLINEPNELLKVINENPNVFFIIDEAFAAFVKDYSSMISKADKINNILILVSLTKTFAIPGIRLGFASSNIEIISKLKTQMIPWSLNTLAQNIGKFIMSDPNIDDYCSKNKEQISIWREELINDLSNIPQIEVIKGNANFLLCRITNSTKLLNASTLYKFLLNEYGIAIRNCGNFRNLNHSFFRIAIKTKKANKTLSNALKAFFRKKTL